MDFDLEHRLRLEKDEGLDSWAINEIDKKGRQIGEDQIPWKWDFDFTATSCVVEDSFDIRSKSHFKETKLATPEIKQRHVIRVQLRPGRPGDDGDYRKTAFSMFGTDRVIKSFQLDIYQITDPAEQERCDAWGTPSYTHEYGTTEDCIVFHLLVKPETFARYSTKILDGSVDEMTFRVGLVAGFYSKWRASTSTRNVKVLTEGSEHKVDLPPDLQVEPPRLGDVGEAELYINRRLEFGKQTPDPETRRSVAVNPPTLKMLRSLRWAAWFVVVLLALILIT